MSWPNKQIHLVNIGVYISNIKLFTVCHQYVWITFAGVLDPFGASGWVRRQQFCIGFIARSAFLAIFWPTLTLPPCQLGQKKFGQKMAKWVPHIVLHVYIQLPSLGEYFRPFKLSFGAISAVLGDKNIPFQLILPLHLRHSAPNFKTYIFGMLIHFLIDLLKRNFWYFFWIWWIFGTHVACA